MFTSTMKTRGFGGLKNLRIGREKEKESGENGGRAEGQKEQSRKNETNR